jgi:spoIIIJ-associated protein
VADSNVFEAETEELAVQRASDALGVPVEQVDYTVVDEGSEGVFGLGSRPVKIRVGAEPGAGEGSGDDDDESREREPARRGPAPEKAAKAEEVVRAILDRMGVRADVGVRDEDEHIVVVIEDLEGSTNVVDVLGKSRPPAIPALQFLLNKVVNRFPEDRKHVTIEVPGVPKREKRKDREARGEGKAAEQPAADAPIPSLDSLRAAVDEELDRTLVEVGLELAERARNLGKTLTIHPMLPGDRRAVHQTIMKIPGVRTVSEGEGLYRKMHVVPDSLSSGGGAGGSGKRRRRRRRGSGRGNRSGSASA